MDKKIIPQWEGRPVARDLDAADLSSRAAIEEFCNKRPRKDAEELVYGNYVKDQRTQAAAHHLANMKAANSVGDKETAFKNWMLYNLHCKALGLEPIGEVPKEIQAHLDKEDRKSPVHFRAHPADIFALQDQDKGKEESPAPVEKSEIESELEAIEALNRPFEKSEALDKMALKDIKVGKQSSTSILHPECGIFDYSHVLSPLFKRRGYLIHVTVGTRQWAPMGPGHLDVSADLYHKGKKAGQVAGMLIPDVGSGVDGLSKRTPGGLHLQAAFLKPEYQGKGLGKALYTAFMAHGHNGLGAKMLHGQTHSSMASRVHESLARKHGLQYHAVANPEAKNAELGPCDEKMKGYHYTLKSEIENELGMIEELGKSESDGHKCCWKLHERRCNKWGAHIGSNGKRYCHMHLHHWANRIPEGKEDVIKSEVDLELYELQKADLKKPGPGMDWGGMGPGMEGAAVTKGDVIPFPKNRVEPTSPSRKLDFGQKASVLPMAPKIEAKRQAQKQAINSMLQDVGNTMASDPGMQAAKRQREVEEKKQILKRGPQLFSPGYHVIIHPDSEKAKDGSIPKDWIGTIKRHHDQYGTEWSSDGSLGPHHMYEINWRTPNGETHEDFVHQEDLAHYVPPPTKKSEIEIELESVQKLIKDDAIPLPQNRVSPAWKSEVQVTPDDLHEAFPDLKKGEENKLPVSQLLVNDDGLRQATYNTMDGKGSRTQGPLSVWKLEDGRHLLVDGHHRLVRHLLNGATAVPYKVIGEGYTDYYAIPQKPFQYKKSRYGGLERFAEGKLLQRIPRQTLTKGDLIQGKFPTGPGKDLGEPASVIEHPAEAIERDLRENGIQPTSKLIQQILAHKKQLAPIEQGLLSAGHSPENVSKAKQALMDIRMGAMKRQAAKQTIKQGSCVNCGRPLEPGRFCPQCQPPEPPKPVNKSDRIKKFDPETWTWGEATPEELEALAKADAVRYAPLPPPEGWGNQELKTVEMGGKRFMVFPDYKIGEISDDLRQYIRDQSGKPVKTK